MEELTLEHVTPYLAHGLKITVKGKRANISSISTKNISFCMVDSGIGEVQKMTWKSASKQIKLLLRPLSELMNDKKFHQLLVDQLQGEKFKLHYNDEVDSLSLIVESDYRELIYLCGCIAYECSYMVYEYMKENLYDFNNLIGKGLAVNINTLKTK